MFGKQRVSSQTVGESKIALESYFEWRAQEVRERNWMNPEMQAIRHARKTIEVVRKRVQNEEAR